MMDMTRDSSELRLRAGASSSSSELRLQPPAFVCLLFWRERVLMFGERFSAAALVFDYM